MGLRDSSTFCTRATLVSSTKGLVERTLDLLASRCLQRSFPLPDVLRRMRRLALSHASFPRCLGHVINDEFLARSNATARRNQRAFCCRIDVTLNATLRPAQIEGGASHLCARRSWDFAASWRA